MFWLSRFLSWVIFISESELKNIPQIPSEILRQCPDLINHLYLRLNLWWDYWRSFSCTSSKTLLSCSHVVIFACSFFFFLKTGRNYSLCPFRIQSSYAALQRINQDLEDKMHRTVRDSQPSGRVRFRHKSQHKLDQRHFGYIKITITMFVFFLFFILPSLPAIPQTSNYHFWVLLTTYIYLST